LLGIIIKYTKHFIDDVFPKRPYLTDELLLDIIEDPIKTEIQLDDKIRLWGFSSVHNKYVRIILLEDGETIHTAFFDRNFKLWGNFMKFNYDKETDSLYINFKDIAGVDSYEIAPDYVVDVDEKGNLIGLEVLDVTNKVDFKTMIFNQIPSSDIRFLNNQVAV